MTYLICLISVFYYIVVIVKLKCILSSSYRIFSTKFSRYFKSPKRSFETYCLCTVLILSHSDLLRRVAERVEQNCTKFQDMIGVHIQICIRFDVSFGSWPTPSLGGQLGVGSNIGFFGKCFSLKMDRNNYKKFLK